MSITERDDVRYVLVSPPFEGDSGLAYLIGFDDVTTIKIVKRHGLMDWIPYVEVWQGDHLYAECAQHQCAVVEFKKFAASAIETRQGGNEVPSPDESAARQGDAQSSSAISSFSYLGEGE